MRFCTAINCMDGRVQLPVIQYLKQRFDAEFVDAITEPGPNRILAENKNPHAVQAIHERVKISIENHKSVGVAVVGHDDCAGNPAPESDQITQLKQAIALLRKQYANIEIIGLWVDENWAVHEIDELSSHCI